MDLIQCIEEAWGWVGVKPDAVLGENEFGNFMIKDSAGQYWRLCPEELSCKVVAADRAELDALIAQEEFQRDWHMAVLAHHARERLGPLAKGEKYCLKIPAILGGSYEPENFGKISDVGLIKTSGHIARQINGLPDGASIQLRIIE